MRSARGRPGLGLTIDEFATKGIKGTGGMKKSVLLVVFGMLRSLGTLLTCICYVFLEIMKVFENNDNFVRWLRDHAGGGRKSITFILVA